MQKIVECVPNFSEGRRPEVIEAITGAVRSVSGCYVLNVSSDADHNRTVITFAGAPESVEEGAFQAISTAAKLINLNEHSGEHPRIGATDVCPFIPVKGMTVEECVVMAGRLGKRVGEELGIAVYLYGEAATRPERRLLSEIRKGEYEKWREEVEKEPHRKPDFGPAIPKSWGATVIGVRPFLIAYNIFLNSSDVDVAKKIAKAVRFSSGGLRNVQAMGFLVDGRAQVSMNLTNFIETPIHCVQEVVRQEAARHGLAIDEAELVGLAPQKALLDAAKWYLKLDDFTEEQVLENQIAEQQGADITPWAILEATAAGTPTPGGGSSAALTGALGAALTQMVANLTIGRKKYVDAQEDATRIASRAAELQKELAASVLADSAAFEEVMKAYRDKSLIDEERSAAVERATIHAGEVPLAVARNSKEVAALALQICRIGNLNAITDAAAGGIMAKAAAEVAGLNVRINATSLNNRELAAKWLAEVAEIEKALETTVTDIKKAASDRGGI